MKIKVRGKVTEANIGGLMEGKPTKNYELRIKVNQKDWNNRCKNKDFEKLKGKIVDIRFTAEEI